MLEGFVVLLDLLLEHLVGDGGGSVMGDGEEELEIVFAKCAAPFWVVDKDDADGLLIPHERRVHAGSDADGCHACGHIFLLGGGILPDEAGLFEGGPANEGAADGRTVGRDARADGELAGLFLANEKCASHGAGDEVQHALQNEGKKSFKVTFCSELKGQLVQHLQPFSHACVHSFEVRGAFGRRTEGQSDFVRRVGAPHGDGGLRQERVFRTEDLNRVVSEINQYGESSSNLTGYHFSIDEGA